MSFLKIKISDEQYDFNKKELKMVLDCTVDFTSALETDLSRNKIDVEHYVTKKISEVAVDRYLDDHADEILKKIDLEAIVKRVQLAVVTRLGQQ